LGIFNDRNHQGLKREVIAFFASLQEWGPQAGWRSVPARGKGGGLLEWDLGHCVWWRVVNQRC